MTHFLLHNILIETAYSGPLDYPTGTQTQTFTLEIQAGKVKQLFPAGQQLPDLPIVEGKGALLLPTLKEWHCHLDKSKLGVPWTPITPANTLAERFTNEIKELDALSVPLKTRARHLLETELSHGVTAIRSHVDVHPAVGQRYLDEVMTLLQEYRGYLDYELVAFPQHGLLRSTAYQEVDQALANGATLIGGVNPESLDGDAHASLAQTFELAVKHDVPIDIHVHDRAEAGRKTVRELIDYTKQANWQGKVAISHAFGLNDFTGIERQEIFAEMGSLGIEVISSVPIDGVIPPLLELAKAGVTVHLGCDNVYDSWSPFGSGNILEKLTRYCELFRQRGQRELTDSLQLITTAYDLDHEPIPWIQTGMPATFSLVDASCTAEFIARMKPVVGSYFCGKDVFAKWVK